MVTLLSAADAAYARSLAQWLQSLERHGQHRHRVVVHDLGLGPARAALERRFPWARWRTFAFQDYPDFVSQRVSSGRAGVGAQILGGYAWKPILVSAALEEAGGVVLWMDSATLVLGSLEPLLEQARRHGCYSPLTGTSSLAELTHPATLARLEAPLEILDRRHRSAGLCAFRADHPGVRRLVERWKEHALDPACLTPPGASQANHRFDQSILSVLLYRAEREEGLRLTEDEQNVSSRKPLRACLVRCKVAPAVPLALDGVCRLFFRARQAGDVALLRARDFYHERVLGFSSWLQNRFSVGVRAQGEDWRWLRAPRYSFFADPFLVLRDGVTWLFAEQFDYRVNRGHLVTLPLGQPGSPQICLRRPYHLSYPFLWQEGERLFMLPESGSNRSLDLYECRRFPEDWVLRRRLFYGLDACDSTLWKQAGLYYLFTSVRAGRNWRLALFWAEALEGPWRDHPVNPRALYADLRWGSGRCAGPLFRDASGRLIRPVQWSRTRYGQGLMHHEVVRLSPEHFEERPVEGPFPWHHRACSPGFEAVDRRL